MAGGRHDVSCRAAILRLTSPAEIRRQQCAKPRNRAAASNRRTGVLDTPHPCGCSANIDWHHALNCGSNRECLRSPCRPSLKFVLNVCESAPASRRCQQPRRNSTDRATISESIQRHALQRSQLVKAVARNFRMRTVTCF